MREFFISLHLKEPAPNYQLFYNITILILPGNYIAIFVPNKRELWIA